jgi:hypothetical protein
MPRARVGQDVHMSPTRIARWSLVLLGAGIALAAVGSDTTADAIGLTIGGIGCVGLVSAIFLAVGLSEDRDRAGH